jgi:hypothetical protein
MLLSFCSLLASGGGDDVRLIAMNDDESKLPPETSSSSSRQPAPRGRWGLLRLVKTILLLVAVLVLTFILLQTRCWAS